MNKIKIITHATMCLIGISLILISLFTLEWIHLVAGMLLFTNYFRIFDNMLDIINTR